MNYILSDANLYNKDEKQSAKIISNVQIMSGAILIPLVLVGGLMYDLFGRKLTVMVTFLFAAISTILVPFVSPNIPVYDICRIILNEALTFIICNPFINDYVKAQGRGKATALQSIGLTAGNLASVGVLFTITEEMMTNRYYSYSLLGGLQVLWAVILYCMIDEPDIFTEAEARREGKKSFCGKLCSKLR